MPALTANKLTRAKFFYGPYSGEERFMQKPIKLWIFPYPYAESISPIADNCNTLSGFKHVYQLMNVEKGHARYEYLDCIRFS